MPWDGVDRGEAAPPTLGVREAGGVSSVDRAAEWAPNISWALKWGCCISFLLKKHFVWLRCALFAAYGIESPDQGSNPGPQLPTPLLHWEHGILASGHREAQKGAS